MIMLAITEPVCWHNNLVSLVADSSFNWTDQHALVSCFRSQA